MPDRLGPLFTAALLALSVLGASPATAQQSDSALIAALKSADRPERRDAALQAVALRDLDQLVAASEPGTGRQASLLLELSLKDGDPELRVLTLQLLRELGRQIEPKLRGEDGERPADEAARERARVRHDAQLLDAVAAALEDPSPRVQLTGIEVLEGLEGRIESARLDAKAPVSRLAQLGRSGATAEIRVAALDLLVSVAPDALVRSALEAAAADPDAAVRDFAALLQRNLAAAPAQERRPPKRGAPR